MLSILTKYEINVTSLTKGQYAAKILFGTWGRCIPVRNYACLAFHPNGDNEAPRSYDKSRKIGPTGTGFTVVHCSQKNLEKKNENFGISNRLKRPHVTANTLSVPS